MGAISTGLGTAVDVRPGEDRGPRAGGAVDPRPFRPGRAIWTVDRELALLLGAGRALLLQLAHPLVAAGVAEWSGFARDPFGRLLRTLRTTYDVVFGDGPTAAAALARMEAMHQRVRGTLREPAGPFPAGTPYDAADPALRLWVHATLVDTSLLVYPRFVRPLASAERAEYYADACLLARLFGIPAPLLPPTLEAFAGYVARMLATEVAVGETARRLARLIFHPPGAPGAGLLAPPVRFVTVGLLPPGVRAQYGYRWGLPQERALAALARLVRRTLPALPPVLRVVPQARAVERRLAGAAAA